MIVIDQTGNGMDGVKDQLKVVDLNRGLFCVRYQDADDERSPPKVVVSVAPGDDRKVEFLLHPDADEATLWQPGTTLVVRVSSAAQLEVQVVPQRRNGSKAASVKFESITQGTPIPIPSQQRVRQTDAGSDAIRLLGHVAGVGDVIVGSNEWLAGPSAPSRVEGIALEWPDMPGGMTLRYAVKSATQAGMPKMMEHQAFAGTRGRGLPITGIVLEMSGPSSSEYQFQAEALFLSAPILRAIGQRVVLSGPTGKEPLVGLRLLMHRTQLSEDVPAFEPPTSALRRASPATGRVRVFRSRPKQDTPEE